MVGLIRLAVMSTAGVVRAALLVLVVAISSFWPLAGRAARPPDASRPAEAADPADLTTHFTIGNELPLPLRLRGSTVLPHVVLAYEVSDSIYIPLAAFCAALDSKVSVGRDRASGWCIRRSTPVRLDLAGAKAWRDDTVIQLTEDDLARHAGDLYIDLNLLDRLLPVALTYDDDAVVLDVTPPTDEPLPYEAAEARAAEVVALLDRKAQQQETPPSLPALRAGYPLLSWPAIDSTLVVAYRRSAEGPSGVTSRYASAWSGDLLRFLSSQVHIAGTRARSGHHRIETGRISFSRHDPIDLGVGGLTFHLGDIFARGDTFVSHSTSGRGIRLVFDTIEPGRDAPFATKLLSGVVEPNHEQLIYLDGFLWDYRRAEATPLPYVLEVPVKKGQTVVERQDYGPKQSYAETVDRIVIGKGRLHPSATAAQLTALEPGRQLIPIADDTAGRADDGSPAVVVGIERGFDNFSAGIGFQSAPHAGKAHQYVDAKLATSLGPAAVQLVVVKETGGGEAANLAAQVALNGTNVSLEHSALSSSFASGKFPTSNDLAGVSRMRAALPPLRLGTSRWLVNMTMEHRQRLSQPDSIRVVQRLSGHAAGISVLNSLRLASAGGREPAIDGKVVVRPVSLGQLMPVVDIGYDVSGARIRHAGLSLRADVAGLTNPRLYLSRSFEGTGNTRIAVGLTHRFPQGIAAGLDAGLTDNGDVGVKLRIFSGLAGEPDHGLRLSADPVTSSFFVDTKVFIDANANAVADDGENNVEGAVLRLNGHPRADLSTDGGGTARLQLRGYGPHHVAVDESSLPFGLMLPPQYGGVRIEGSRPLYRNAALPVVHRSEMFGRVRTAAGLPISGVRLELVRTSDWTTAVLAATSFDGTWIMDRIPPGRYRLQMVPEQQQATGLSVAARIIEFGGARQTLRNIDLVLRKTEQEHATLASSD